MNRARDRLTPEAKYILSLHGISAVGWARWCNNGDEQWYGDACGCTDDRCADERWHHRPQDPCGCLYALVVKREALDSEIGERLHWWMWRNRVSQVELARKTGMSQPSLGRKLRGSTPWLASEVRDISRAIGKPISWLYGDVEDEDSARPKGLEPLTFWSGVWADAA